MTGLVTAGNIISTFLLLITFSDPIFQKQILPFVKVVLASAIKLFQINMELENNCQMTSNGS